MKADTPTTPEPLNPLKEMGEAIQSTIKALEDGEMSKEEKCNVTTQWLEFGKSLGPVIGEMGDPNVGAIVESAMDIALSALALSGCGDTK